MKRILFQGDSITDAGRNRDNLFSLGEGYPQLVAAKLSFKCPGEFEFINKGVSGDKSTQLYARCKEEIINLAPDYLSILIGVNDIWHELAVGGGVSVKRYVQLLSMLIEDVKEALPETKIALLEPFVLKGPATEDQWNEFRSGVEARAAAAREIADKYGLIFIELQQKLDEADKKAPSCWLADGVHPAPAGHELIAQEWLKAFNL